MTPTVQTMAAVLARHRLEQDHAGGALCACGRIYVEWDDAFTHLATMIEQALATLWAES